MSTQTPPKQTRRRQGRALYVAIDPELRDFVDRESVQTRQTRTAIVEEALRRLFVERHQDELARETLPDLRQVVRAELDAQLNELDRELKSQVRGLERRLGNRVAGLSVKAVRAASQAHTLAERALMQARMAYYLIYNFAAAQVGPERVDGWSQDAADDARALSLQYEQEAAEVAGHLLRATAPPDDVAAPPAPPEQDT